MVVAQGGVKLKALQGRSGAKVTIDRKPTTDTETKVIVKGTPDEVADAKAQIEFICFDTPLPEEFR